MSSSHCFLSIIFEYHSSKSYFLKCKNSNKHEFLLIFIFINLKTRIIFNYLKRHYSESRRKGITIESLNHNLNFFLISTFIRKLSEQACSF